MHMGDWEVILQLGAEGGSVTLYGMETERGWLFYPVVNSWEAAVALLDRYPWQRLCPLMIHPEFSERVRSAARDRLQRDQAPARYFDMWCRMISTGNNSV